MGIEVITVIELTQRHQLPAGGNPREEGRGKEEGERKGKQNRKSALGFNHPETASVYIHMPDFYLRPKQKF